jgi:hypothetical protein
MGFSGGGCGGPRAARRYRYRPGLPPPEGIIMAQILIRAFIPEVRKFLAQARAGLPAAVTSLAAQLAAWVPSQADAVTRLADRALVWLDARLAAFAG